uniref:Uncharacterized protein n=1 Tax=Lutzomyia longipalpis TaxID=7200 RepID=A0A1B0CV89_LUTLO
MHWAKAHHKYESKLATNVRSSESVAMKVEKPKKNMDATKASRMLALETGRLKKPFSDAGRWRDVFSNILKNRYTISRNISHISEKMRDEMIRKIKESKKISIAIDESTDISHHSQLMIFIRGIMPDNSTFESYLDLRQLRETTRGEDIYEEVFNALKEFGALDKLVSLSTDGAPSMNAPYGDLKLFTHFDKKLKSRLHDDEFWRNIAFLGDITKYLNDLNLSLQVNGGVTMKHVTLVENVL